MSLTALTTIKEPLSLSDFLTQVKQTIDERFNGNHGYWVRGEISQWQKNAGHFYGELVEFDDNTQQMIAKVRINMWASMAIKINAKFQRSTGESLKSGLKVLLLIEPSFHQTFGLSLNILDIDPSFTLGDRQARKQAIWTRLEQEGLHHKNLNLKTPNDFTHVAVVSSMPQGFRIFSLKRNSYKNITYANLMSIMPACKVKPVQLRLPHNCVRFTKPLKRSKKTMIALSLYVAEVLSLILMVLITLNQPMQFAICRLLFLPALGISAIKRYWISLPIKVLIPHPRSFNLLKKILLPRHKMHKSILTSPLAKHVIYCNTIIKTLSLNTGQHNSL